MTKLSSLLDVWTLVEISIHPYSPNEHRVLSMYIAQTTSCQVWTFGYWSGSPLWLETCVHFMFHLKAFHLQAFHDNFLRKSLSKKESSNGMDKHGQSFFFVKLVTQLKVPSIENEANQQLTNYVLWQPAQQRGFHTFEGDDDGSRQMQFYYFYYYYYNFCTK